MAVNSSQFEEKQWRKSLRHLKEDFYVITANLMEKAGLLNDYPKNPVFIIGSPRSGTSIFTKMINAHPDVANFSEAIYIWDKKDTDPMRDHVKNANDILPSDSHRIKSTFGMYQYMKGKSCFVNKCPRSSVRIPYITEIFPTAKFIHVYRDGREVVNSMINIINREPFRQSIPLGDFCKPENWRDLIKLPALEAHAHQWVEIMNEIERAKTQVNKNCWFDIKYEDFCGDSSNIMGEVFEFMDIEASQGLMDKIGSMAVRNDQKWKNSFSSDQINTLNKIMHEGLEKYGYESE